MYFSRIERARTMAKGENALPDKVAEAYRDWLRPQDLNTRTNNLTKYKASPFKLENCRKVNKDGKIMIQDARD